MTKADSSCIVRKTKLTAGDPPGWYECHHDGKRFPLVVLWWENGTLHYAPGIIGDIPIQDGYTGFRGPLDCRNLTAAAEALRERWHKKYRPEIVDIACLVREAVTELGAVKPVPVNPISQALWQAVLRVIKAAADDPGRTLDCAAVQVLSDVATDYARQALAEPADCPECAKLVEFFRTEEKQAGLDGDGAKLSPADAILKFARNQKEIAALHFGTLDEICKTVLGTYKNRIDADHLIDAVRELKLDPGGKALAEAIDRVEETLKECGVGFTTSTRKVTHISLAETMAAVRSRLLPFVLPPPGTTFRAEVDTATPGEPRTVIEFHHFANGRISGDLGETWHAASFQEKHAVLVKD